jgi:hypothetical protein
MKKNIKTALSVTAVVLAFALAFVFLNMLVQPKYASDLVEGGMISEYYDRAGGHDVVFVGDCEVYANFTPMEMYREAGIKAYVRGTSQQLVWQSYYILEETFRYESPKVVVFNVNAMRYSQPVKEEYHRLTIDEMRWSAQKVGIIQASMTEEETFLSYVFPILRYHSRITQLTAEDITYLFDDEQITWQGHLVNDEVKPLGRLPSKKALADYSFGDICWDYLEKMRLLCEENGAELILIKAPSVYPYWYDEYDAQIEEYAAKHGLSFYNFLDYVDQIGIDYQVDTYDAGLHMNLSGATKLSAYFAKILSQEHNVPDHRGDAAFDEMLKAYDEATK